MTPRTPAEDRQLVLDALTRAAVVIIAAAAVTIAALLAEISTMHWIG